MHFDRPRRTSEAVREWREPLRELLGASPPTPALVLRNPEGGVFCAPPELLVRCELQGRQFVPPPLGPIVVRRESPAHIIRASSGWHWTTLARLKYSWPPSFDVVLPGKRRVAGRHFDEFFQASQTGDAGYLRDLPDETSVLLWERSHRSEVDERAVDFAWEQIERELAVTWLALVAAVARADAVRLQCGWVLLPVGRGIFADIQVRSHAGQPTWRAALEQPLWLDRPAPHGEKTWNRDQELRFGHRLRPARVHVTGFSGHGEESSVWWRADEWSGPRIPVAMHLASNTHRATVRFHASSFHE